MSALAWRFIVTRWVVYERDAELYSIWIDDVARVPGVILFEGEHPNEDWWDRVKVSRKRKQKGIVHG